MIDDIRDRIAATIAANPDANVIAMHISDVTAILHALRSVELIGATEAPKNVTRIRRKE